MCGVRLHNYRIDCIITALTIGTIITNDVLITAPNDRCRLIDLGIVRVITSLVDLHGPVCELRSQCILIQLTIGSQSVVGLGVEQLFSVGGQIMILRGNGLSNGSFEKLLLLRQNNLA